MGVLLDQSSLGFQISFVCMFNGSIVRLLRSKLTLTHLLNPRSLKFQLIPDLIEDLIEASKKPSIQGFLH